tara:strand:+ start:51 stop:311 length:261 start_codon:yes stop_codon:yes gene_type:complete
MTTTNNEIIRFEAGRTYTTRSICDSECVFAYEIIRRTAASVWVRGINGMVVRRKIEIWEGQETCLPEGRYSMAPVIKASRRQWAVV